MARKYGGKTGLKTTPTDVSAPGAWVATEVYRERTTATWPSFFSSAGGSAGDIFFVASSGVVTAENGTTFLVCSGQNVSRTTYATLFDAINTTFGSGDGSTTFTLPNLFDKHIYVAGTTTSGLTNPTILGSGVLGQHTHTMNGSQAAPSTPSDGNPGGTACYSTGGATVRSSFDPGSGRGGNNESRHREAVPVILLTNTNLPVGSIFPALYPQSFPTTWATVPSSRILVASGQDVSRSTYSTLYTRLGNLYGSGDNSTTFTLPDYRGIFISGPRELNKIQPSGIIAPSGFIPDDFIQHAHDANFNDGSSCRGSYNGCGGGLPGNFATTPASSTYAGNNNESRPANISVIWCLVAN